MKNHSVKGQDSSISREYHSSILGEIFNPEERLIFLIGNADVGKTHILKNYVDVRKSNRILKLGCDGKSCLEIEGENLFSFFDFPFDVLADDFFTLLDHECLKGVDEIIIDGFNFERIDVFQSILNTLQFSLLKSNKKRVLDNVRIVFSGRPVLNKSNSDIIDYYKKHLANSVTSRWPYPKLVSMSNKFHNENTLSIDYLQDNQKLTLKSLLTYPVRNACPESSVLVSNSKSNVFNFNIVKLDSLYGRDFILSGEIKGSFDLIRPVPSNMHIKSGARVMFVEGKEGYYKKGDFGIILNTKNTKEVFYAIIGMGNDFINVLLDNGRLIKVKPHTWKQKAYSVLKNKYILSDKGSYIQYPFIVSYAMSPALARRVSLHNVHLDFTNISSLVNYISNLKDQLGISVSPVTRDLIDEYVKQKNKIA